MDEGQRASRADDRVGAALFERIHDPSRVLALTDGVFAIIITLLVLDIHIPELSSDQSLTEALREVRPSFIAFVISFIVAGMYWVAHRELFAILQRTDRGLVWLNLLHLLPLCLLPFGASLLGRHNQEPVGLRIYGLILVAIAATRAAIWLYATGRTHLLWRPLNPAQRRSGLVLTVSPGLVYLLALLIADVAPAVSLAIYGGLPLLYFLSITVLRRDSNWDEASLE